MEHYNALRFSLQSHLLIINKTVEGVVPRGTLNDRGQIKDFSESSGIRMRRYLRTCDVDYTHFITLTYPFGFTRDGRESKEHLRVFMQKLKRVGEYKEKFSAFWFMEFQERGAIHYHIFTNRFFNKDWLSKTWYEIVGSEDERHLHAGTNIQKLKSGRYGTCSYASKYAAKMSQKTPPECIKNFGRFWGVVGYRLCVSADILLTEATAAATNIKRSLIRLRETLRSLVKQKTAQRLSRKGSCAVYVLKTDHAKREVQRLMLKLEVQVGLWGSQPLFLMPHHEILKEDLLI